MCDFVFSVKGKRPFGVSLLYIGWDKHYGFQLYQSDPSGNYGGWKATCIGNNSAVSIFGGSVTTPIKMRRRDCGPEVLFSKAAVPSWSPRTGSTAAAHHVGRPAACFEEPGGVG